MTTTEGKRATYQAAVRGGRRRPAVPGPHLHRQLRRHGARHRRDQGRQDDEVPGEEQGAGEGVEGGRPPRRVHHRRAQRPQQLPRLEHLGRARHARHRGRERHDPAPGVRDPGLHARVLPLAGDPAHDHRGGRRRPGDHGHRRHRPSRDRHQGQRGARLVHRRGRLRHGPLRPARPRSDQGRTTTSRSPTRSSSSCSGSCGASARTATSSTRRTATAAASTSPTSSPRSTAQVEPLRAGQPEARRVHPVQRGRRAAGVPRPLRLPARASATPAPTSCPTATCSSSATSSSTRRSSTGATSATTPGCRTATRSRSSSTRRRWRSRRSASTTSRRRSPARRTTSRPSSAARCSSAAEVEHPDGRGVPDQGRRPAEQLGKVQTATLKLYQKTARMYRRDLIWNGQYVYYIDMILPHLRLAGTYDEGLPRLRLLGDRPAGRELLLRHHQARLRPGDGTQQDLLRGGLPALPGRGDLRSSKGRWL